jgi:FAD synthase
MHSNVLKEFGLRDSQVTGYNLKVEVKGTDFQGRPMAIETEHDSIETVAAYLKLVNIPCIFDVGTRPPNHKHGTLAMNLLDDRTYQEVIKPEFLDKDRTYNKQKKAEQLKEALQACHVNIDVSEVVITVLGYVVE